MVDSATQRLQQEGISPISWLELTLREGANGACRQIIEDLLSLNTVSILGDSAQAGERKVKGCKKSIQTLFGLVTISRNWYKAEGSEGRFPMDTALALVGSYTPTLAALMARCAANEPYERAAESFKALTGVPVEARQFLRVVEDLRGLAEKFQLEPSPGEKSRPPRAYVAVDGTGAPMRKEELDGIKGRQEDGSARTREVKVCAIFTQSDLGSEKPWRDIGSTTYRASTLRSNDFGPLVRQEFDRRFSNAPETVFIGDGAKWLWELKRIHFPWAVEIVDYYHASEKLGMLAEDVYQRASKEWRALYDKWKTLLWEGCLEEIQKDYKMLTTQSKESGKWTYFENNKHRMRYAEYRKHNYFIGSGAVESACKTVIGQRFKGSGMRWSLDGLDALLPIKTLLESNRFDEFIDYIEQKKEAA